MLNLVRADLYKLRKSIAIKILLGITILSSIAMLMIAYQIPQGNIDSSMTGIGFMFSDINVMSILGAVLAGLFICGDFESKVIHNAISNGNSRSSIIISKAITYVFALEMILIPYVIVTVIAINTGYKYSMGSVSVGFLNILTSVAGTAINSSEVIKLFIVIITLMLVYAAQLSVCIPLAFISRKPVLVVAVSYGISILSAQLSNLKDSSPLFYKLFSFTPFGGNHSMITLSTQTPEIIKAFTVSIFFIALIVLITYFLFRRQEVK